MDDDIQVLREYAFRLPVFPDPEWGKPVQPVAPREVDPNRPRLTDSGLFWKFYRTRDGTPVWTLDLPVVEALDRGLTAGASDVAIPFLAAGNQTLVNWMNLRPGDFDRNFRAATEVQEEKKRQFHEEHPWGALGSEVTGSAVPAGRMAQGFSKALDATNLSRAGKNFIAGAFPGMFWGAGLADGDIRSKAYGALVGAGLGGGVSAALGEVVPPALRFAQRFIGHSARGSASAAGAQLGRESESVAARARGEVRPEAEAGVGPSSSAGEGISADGAVRGVPSDTAPRPNPSEAQVELVPAEVQSRASSIPHSPQGPEVADTPPSSTIVRGDERIGSTPIEVEPALPPTREPPAEWESLGRRTEEIAPASAEVEPPSAAAREPQVEWGSLAPRSEEIAPAPVEVAPPSAPAREPQVEWGNRSSPADEIVPKPVDVEPMQVPSRTLQPKPDSDAAPAPLAARNRAPGERKLGDAEPPQDPSRDSQSEIGSNDPAAPVAPKPKAEAPSPEGPPNVAGTEGQSAQRGPRLTADELRQNIATADELGERFGSPIEAVEAARDAANHVMILHQKALSEGVSPRDAGKAFIKTRVSIRRSDLDRQTFEQGGKMATRTAEDLRAKGIELPEGMKYVRAEDVPTYWYSSNLGKRYLDNLEKGIVDGEAIDDLVELMRPFGKTNDLKDALSKAPILAKSLAEKATDMIRRDASAPEWNAYVRDIVPGVSDGKAGYLGWEMGYPHSVVVDSRILGAVAGPNVEGPLPRNAKVLADVLSDLYPQLKINLEEALQPYKKPAIHNHMWNGKGRPAERQGETLDRQRRALLDLGPMMLPGQLPSDLFAA